MHYSEKTFKQALRFGQRVENSIYRFLKQRFPNETITKAPNGVFKDWDLKRTCDKRFCPSGFMTYEIKTDTFAPKTGRFFLETGQITPKGKTRKTGLSCTKADYLVLVSYTPFTSYVWAAKMQDVKEYIAICEARGELKTVAEKKLGYFLTCHELQTWGIEPIQFTRDLAK